MRQYLENGGTKVAKMAANIVIEKSNGDLRYFKTISKV